MAKITRQRPPVEQETPRSRPRRKKRGRLFVVIAVVVAYLDVCLVMVGLGATVQLWTAPGSSLLWKLVLPLLTIAGIVVAIRQYRSRPRDPFTGLLRAEFSLAVAGAFILAALAAAPN